MPFVVSFRRRLAFIHVPKTGGISLWQALQPEDDLALWRRDPGLAKAVALTHGVMVPQATWRALAALPIHASAREVAAALAPVAWNSLNSVAVVRNPWALEVSLYHYVRKNLHHPAHAAAAALPDFAAWVDWQARRGPHPQQAHLLCDATGAPMVRHFLRFESLAEDWSALAADLGLPPMALPHLNRGGQGRWQDVYTPALFAAVATLRAADVALTGLSGDPLTWDLKP